MLQAIFEKHTAPGAYSKHAPGAMCISNMVLEHKLRPISPESVQGALFCTVCADHNSITDLS